MHRFERYTIEESYLRNKPVQEEVVGSRLLLVENNGFVPGVAEYLGKQSYYYDIIYEILEKIEYARCFILVLSRLQAIRQKHRQEKRDQNEESDHQNWVDELIVADRALLAGSVELFEVAIGTFLTHEPFISIWACVISQANVFSS